MLQLQDLDPLDVGSDRELAIKKKHVGKAEYSHRFSHAETVGFGLRTYPYVGECN